MTNSVQNMKGVLESASRIVGTMVLALVVISTLVGSVILTAEYFFLKYFIQQGSFESVIEHRERFFAISVIFLVPALVIAFWKEVPHTTQADFKILGLSAMAALSWLGYGFLFAVSMYLFSIL